MKYITSESFVVAKQQLRHKLWTESIREKYERSNRRYASDLMGEEWEWVEPFLPDWPSSNGGFARSGEPAFLHGREGLLARIIHE